MNMSVLMSSKSQIPNAAPRVVANAKNFLRWVLSHFYACTIALLGCACAGDPDKPLALSSPVAAEDAVKTFALAPGFKIELVAAEPLIADPVAMEIDENGNLYVVENHGYPLDKTRTSKVKLLRDTDGDGTMDESMVFADSLLMPTGIMRWKKGILVTDAPDLLYMEDADGDGKADIIRSVLTGFALSNPQHNVNSPVLGLDNWIYIAHERAVGSEVYKSQFGDTGKEIYFPDNPVAPRLPQNAGGRNVRLRPDTYELEMLASTTQYGQTFDEWGNHFLVNNSNHLMHSVIGAGYINRNPAMRITTGTKHLPDHGNAAEVFPITQTPDRQLLTDVGVMTSACALTYYAGGAFPHGYNAQTTFVAEPVANIVHADRLRDNGASFVASRVQSDSEFLASTDMWSRPVNLYIGPDGALYMVDYYREIIEHPEWLSDEVIQSGRLYNGHDRGRIFRISAADAPPASWTTDLKNLHAASDDVLVGRLADPNIWWRKTAQRMLIDRNHPAIIPLLREMTTNTVSAEGRLHALWTLQGVNRLQKEIIEKALLDQNPGVRVNAIKLAELYLNDHPSLIKNLIAMHEDENAKVRFQLLCTLGFVDTQEAAEARDAILFHDIGDEFVQVAALTATSSRNEPLLRSVLDRYEIGNSAYANMVLHLTAMVAANPRSAYSNELLEKATEIVPANSIHWQLPVLKGIARAYGSREEPLHERQLDLLLRTFFDHPVRSIKEACLGILQESRMKGRGSLTEAMDQARDIVKDSTLPDWERALAIRFLALEDPAPDKSLLTALIRSGEPIPIQLAAIRTMNVIPDETITLFAMEQWPTLDPAVQDAALNAFMEKESRMKVLLEALELGKIQKSSVGWQRSIRLMTQRNIELRNRARAFFTNDERMRNLIDDYKAALTLKGDVDNGKSVFQRQCAICHQVKGTEGIPFGPDLGTIQSWPASGIMENILNPNQSISHGFDIWNITLKNGESLQGLITTETPTSITVRNANGEVTTIVRDDIASQKALNMSAMPEGLESNISHQEMADLLIFLRKGQ